MQNDEKILFFEDLVKIIPRLNRTSLGRWIKAGKFPPASIKVGSRRIGWLSSDINAWLDQLKIQ